MRGCRVGVEGGGGLDGQFNYNFLSSLSLTVGQVIHFRSNYQ